MDSVKKRQRFIDIDTYKRVHEHLKDETDNISDDDINRAATDITKMKGSTTSIENATNEKFREDKQENGSERREEDSSQDPGIETTWNILK